MIDENVRHCEMVQMASQGKTFYATAEQQACKGGAGAIGLMEPPEKVNRVMIAVRPENIIFSNESFLSSLRNQLKGTILDVIQIGPTVWIEVEVENNKFKGLLTPSSLDMLGIKKDKEIYLSFKAINVKIIKEDSYNGSLS